MNLEVSESYFSSVPCIVKVSCINRWTRLQSVKFTRITLCDGRLKHITYINFLNIYTNLNHKTIAIRPTKTLNSRVLSHLDLVHVVWCEKLEEELKNHDWQLSHALDQLWRKYWWELYIHSAPSLLYREFLHSSTVIVSCELLKLQFNQSTGQTFTVIEYITFTYHSSNQTLFI